MRSGVIAKKLGMTRLFLEDGRQVPVTVLQLDGLQVVAQRTADRDGYTAVQLGAGAAKANIEGAAIDPFRTGAAHRQSARGAGIDAEKTVAARYRTAILYGQFARAAKADIEDVVAPLRTRSAHGHNARGGGVVADNGGPVRHRSAILDGQCACAAMADIETDAIGPFRARPAHRHRAGGADIEADIAGGVRYRADASMLPAPLSPSRATGVRPAE